MGEAPEWYRLIRAARYLGVAPWDLQDRWVFWANAALTAEEVEARFAEQEHDRERRRSAS